MRNQIKTAALTVAIIAISSTSFAQTYNNGSHSSSKIYPSQTDYKSVHIDNHGMPAEKIRYEYELPATPEQVNNIIKAIKNTSFDKNKMDLAKLCLSLRSMRTEDIIRITKIFSFDSSKLEFLKYAYNYCTDRYNYHKTEKLLSFSSSIRELRQYIQTSERQYHNNSHQNAAISPQANDRIEIR